MAAHRQDKKDLLAGALTYVSAKYRALIDRLWELFLSIGDDGCMFDRCRSLLLSLKEAREEMFREQLAEIAIPTLQGALSNSDAWKAWCVGQGIHPWRANSMEVCSFLRSFKQEGLCAAHGRFTRLRWLQTTLGARLWTDSPEVKRQGLVVPHEITQAAPLALRALVGLEKCSEGSNVFVVALCLYWLPGAYGVIRPGHIQRSRLQALFNTALEFKATKGKKTVEGTRRPFCWRCPRFGLTGVDLGSNHLRVLQLLGTNSTVSDNMLRSSPTHTS